MMPAPKGNQYAKGSGNGRPTDYNPDYCEQLIQHMSQGLSFESFAGFIEVTKKTLYNWTAEHKDFLHAKHIGTEKCRLYFEQKGLDGMNNKIPFFNERIWRLNMINRFREEWTDRVDSDVTSKGEKIDVSKYSTEELNQVVSILRKSDEAGNT